jgi:kynurenine 3-monooxygenase
MLTLYKGDAAHAIVPFFGQGMNAGFEDCKVFNDLLNQHGSDDWEKLFKAYQEARKVNADAIADMAQENFIEMRDKVADPVFLFKKKVQHMLGNEFPGRFLSRYELVSFTTKSYAEAFRLGALGDKVTDELIKDIPDLDIQKVDMKKAKELMDTHFPNPIL